MIINMKKMSLQEFAEMLDGRKRGQEITPEETKMAEELGFVVVFGYSDDCAEFRGAYYEEADCFDGGRVYENNEQYIDAVWNENGYLWIYNTNIPHETFDIYDENRKYCRGIVFCFSD